MTGATTARHKADRDRLAGRYRSAIDQYGDALRQNGSDAEALYGLGLCFRAVRDDDKAHAALQRAIAADPAHKAARTALGWLHLHHGYSESALQFARAARALAPADAGAASLEGMALFNLADVSAALVCLEQARALAPDDLSIWQQYLYALSFRRDQPAAGLRASFAAFGDRLAQAAGPFHAHRNEPSPDRRLRVGYVSPDLRRHAAAGFIEALIANHDKEQVELYAYAEVPQPDAVTERLRGHFDHWRETVGLSDDDLAALVRNDAIDLLVESAGVTTGNRLGAFAWRPAPVQVCWPIGTGTTTGLLSFDCAVMDGRLAPAGTEAVFVEPLRRLDSVYAAYRPPGDAGDCSELPALAAGRITFGYIGRLVRLNPDVVSCWSEILRAVPRSRLLLNHWTMGRGGVPERIRARFARFGIEPERLAIGYSDNPWDLYREIDIALDPFPHNSGLTTFEALWMGVPSVSLAGQPAVGRFGAAILPPVGLQDWVVETGEAYARLAVAAAQNLAALATLRRGLRGRMALSALCDGRRFAAEMEALYRSLWHDWCARHGRA